MGSIAMEGWRLSHNPYWGWDEAIMMGLFIAAMGVITTLATWLQERRTGGRYEEPQAVREFVMFDLLEGGNGEQS